MFSKTAPLALIVFAVPSLLGPPETSPVASKVAVEAGPCPVPSASNLRLAGWNIDMLLGSESRAWHRARLGIEGATRAEVVSVTDPAVCQQLDAVHGLVRDGEVWFLPYRVRGVTLAVYARRFGEVASGAYPPSGPVAVENAVLW